MVLTERCACGQWIRGTQDRVPWTFLQRGQVCQRFHKSCKLFGQLSACHLAAKLGQNVRREIKLMQIQYAGRFV